MSLTYLNPDAIQDGSISSSKIDNGGAGGAGGAYHQPAQPCSQAGGYVCQPRGRCGGGGDRR